MKKLEEMTLEELRVEYTNLKTEKENGDNTITKLNEEKSKLTEDNKRLQEYNNKLFAQIPNLNKEKEVEKPLENQLTFENLFKKIEENGGMF